jgi:hypothetical protein
MILDNTALVIYKHLFDMTVFLKIIVSYKTGTVTNYNKIWDG